MLNATLSTSFVTWRHNAKDEHRLKAVCARIVLRMLNATLSKSFVTWHNNAITFRKKVHMVCVRARACVCHVCVCVLFVLNVCGANAIPN
jgi:hypothetical protein